MISLSDSMGSDSEPESRLISLISQLISLDDSDSDYVSEVISHTTQIISLVSSIDLDSQPKPESEFMSLTTQSISLFNSMDLDSQPEPLKKLVSFISQKFSLLNSIDSDSDSKFMPLVRQTLSLEPEPELMSLIHQIFSLVISMNSKSRKLISLSPKVLVRFENGRYYEIGEFFGSNNKWDCLPSSWEKFRGIREEATHFRCLGCNGEKHKEYDKVPVEIKHPLHPKHSLQLVLLQPYITKGCYCCDECLRAIFYYCSACDVAMNIACVEKPQVLSIHHPKWHEHTLTLLSRHISLTCNLCAMSDPSCPFYICSPCGFVVHQKCTSLPRVIRISRHPHRISFTPSFDQGDWYCGVCRRTMDNDYGGYSCITCSSYAVHTKCATGIDLWDGIELEGEPEENDEEEIDEEEIHPFVRISDEIIQYFSHPHHQLRLDEVTGRDYDENKLCQACITPIYYGDFYSCMQCEFILHKECAKFPRKIRHLLHSHVLTLVGGYDGVMNDDNNCSACPQLCTAGFFYKCGIEKCCFKLHVQCAITSEPFSHENHEHLLYLTSKPGEERICSVCKQSGHCLTNQTFNCIEECEFALCFKCATLPQKVRYTDDKHMLTLSYGKETSTMILWCEECEIKIDQSVGFYMCDEYCCVALHIECLLGVDLYMIPGSSWLYYGSKVHVLPNNCHPSRPICSNCKKRCPHKIVLQCSGFIFCSTFCIRDSVDRGDKIA